MRSKLTTVAVIFLIALTAIVTQPVFAATPNEGLQQPSGRQSQAEGTSMPFPNQALSAGARLYVAPMPNGFDTYVIAGLEKKKVPLKVVTIREKADFELTGVSETDQASWAKMLFLNDSSTAETASVKIVDLKTGDVVFAYSVKKGNSARGKQSAAESVAKHIKAKIENIAGGS